MTPRNCDGGQTCSGRPCCRVGCGDRPWPNGTVGMVRPESIQPGNAAYPRHGEHPPPLRAGLPGRLALPTMSVCAGKKMASALLGSSNRTMFDVSEVAVRPTVSQIRLHASSWKVSEHILVTPPDPPASYRLCPHAR
jgi:hypothetical protein